MEADKENTGFTNTPYLLGTVVGAVAGLLLFVLISMGYRKFLGVDPSAVSGFLFPVIVGPLGGGLLGYTIYKYKTLADQNKQQVAASHKQNELFKDTQKVAQLGCWELDLKTYLAEWSDEEFRLLGYELGSIEAGYETFNNAVHPDDRDAVNAEVEKAIKGEVNPYEIAHRVVLQGGGERTVLQRGRVIRDDSGSPCRLIGTTQDITERICADGKLRESEEQFRRIFEDASIGMTVTELDGRFQRVNDALSNMLGYSKEALSKMSISEVTHPDDLAITLEDREKLLTDKIRQEAVEKRYLHKDGSVVWGSITRSVIRDINGDPQYTVAQVQDITKRKLMEEALQNTNDQLELRVAERTHALTEEIEERRTIEAELIDRTELQQLLYAVAATANETDNADTAMAACLKQVCDYTTWPVGHIYALSPSDPDELIPTDIWYMEDPEWFSVFHELTMKTTFKRGVGLPGRVLASGKPEWIEDVTGNPAFVRANMGVDIIVKACFGFPIKVGNKAVAVMEFFSPFDQKADRALMQSIEHIGTQLGRLYEREEAQRNLFEAKETAEIANKTKSDFLSSMSHELRTPLNAIIGFSGMIKEETFGPLGNDQYREYMDDIHHSGRHLLELINDILDVSTIEAGALELQEDNISLSDIVEASIHFIKPRADDVRINVSAAIDPEIPPLYADGRRVKQVLLNLLSNAVKFTPEEGEVSVSARLDDNGSLGLTVADTGIGMGEEEIETALSRFGQVDTGLDRKHEGTGLGLPLTMGLMELHGGTLEIHSEKGHGTRITVTFPKERIVHNVR